MNISIFSYDWLSLIDSDFFFLALGSFFDVLYIVSKFEVNA